MKRFLKGDDLKGLTHKDLLNYDWDVIELPHTIDSQAMMEWYNTVAEKHSDSIFHIGKLNVIRPDFRVKAVEFAEKHLWGKGEQWTLQWSYQREGVIPFVYVADPAQYPEINEPDFMSVTSNTNLEKYVFGAYKRLIETFGPSCYKVTRLVRFAKDTGLKQHVDINPPEFLVRMHAQIQSDKDCHWFFGKDMERSYPVEQGKIYLYNTAVVHAAVNRGDNYWIMVHNNPDDEAIDQLLSMDPIHVS